MSTTLCSGYLNPNATSLNFIFLCVISFRFFFIFCMYGTDCTICFIELDAGNEWSERGERKRDYIFLSYRVFFLQYTMEKRKWSCKEKERKNNPAPTTTTSHDSPPAAEETVVMSALERDRLLLGKLVDVNEMDDDNALVLISYMRLKELRK